MRPQAGRPRYVVSERYRCAENRAKEKGAQVVGDGNDAGEEDAWPATALSPSIWLPCRSPLEDEIETENVMNKQFGVYAPVSYDSYSL